MSDLAQNTLTWTPLTKWCALLIVALFLPPVGNAWSQNADCDRLAAYPYDKTRPQEVVGVFEIIDTSRAIDACTTARAATQDDSRLIFQLGRAVQDSGDKARAFQLYQEAADKGHVAAQARISFMYWRGDARDDLTYLGTGSRALTWARTAADQGDPDAQYQMGYRYQIGDQVPMDYAQALAWYFKAANQDHGLAQFFISQMYEYGLGVPKSQSQAKMWDDMAKRARAKFPCVSEKREYVPCAAPSP